LPELTYMVLRELGYGVLVDFLHAVLRGELKLERATEADLQRTAEILRQYADSHIDFVDCAITAMAERAMSFVPCKQNAGRSVSIES